MQGEFKTQRELLQAIYEGIGSESLNDFYYGIITDLLLSIIVLIIIIVDVISRRNAACRFINSTLKDDPNVTGIVPFHPLYSLKVVSDGSILWYYLALFYYY